REIDIVGQRNLAGMNAENLFTPANIRQRNNDATVKAAGTQQRRIKHIRTVGGRDQDHAFIGFEAIHLDQQLIQGLFTLIVASAQTSAAVAAYGIDFINEDDARCILFSLLKQVADT